MRIDTTNRQKTVFLFVLLLVGFASALQAQPDMRGFIAADGGSGATMTIDESGVYPLKTDFIGEILITADDVVLELRGFAIDGGTNGIRITGNNVTVKNGVVRGATEVGVKIEGDKNRLEGLDLVSNTTGVELSSANANIIENCRALCNASAGFSLFGSQRNCVINCKAVDNGGNANSFGFVSQAGMCNTFDGCVAENTNTSGVDPFFAAGFVLTGTEQKSKIVHSQADNTEGANAFGIKLEQVSPFALNEVDSSAPGGEGVAWQVCDGTKYLASATPFTASTGTTIFRFDPTPTGGTLTSIDSDTTANGQNLDWLGKLFIPAVNAVMQVFEFDGVGINPLTTSTFDHGAGVLDAKWLVCGDSTYVAIGGDDSSFDGADVRILEFDTTTSLLSQVGSATFDHGSIILDIDWLVCGDSKYLAIGGGSGTGGVGLRVLEFDTVGLVLREVTNISAIGVFPVPVWQVCNGTKYLATGDGAGGVRIYEFDNTAETLTQVGSTLDVGDDIRSMDWLVCNNIKYLGVGSFSGGQKTVLLFDPFTSALTEVASFAGATKGVAWQLCDNRAFLATPDSQTRVLEFNGCQFPTCNLIKKNHVSGTTSSVATGTAVGLQDDLGDSSTNEIYSNFSCKNDINFDIGSQFPISSAQAKGVGETENIDCSLPATVGPEACAPIAITSATTLSSDTTYCLAQMLAGTITINNVENVTLDLNGNAVSNIAISSSQRVCVANGIVTDATGNGVLVSTSTQVRLENMLIENAGTNGIRIETNSFNIVLHDVQVNSCAADGICIFDSQGIQIKDCLSASNTDTGILIDGTTDVVCESCLFSGNGGPGALISSTNSTFQLCQAHQNGSHGFEINSADQNYLWQCDAANNTGNGFTVVGGGDENLVRECHAQGNGGIGFNTDSVGTNVFGANYSQGNTGLEYVGSIEFGSMGASNSGMVEYWSNVDQ